MSGPRLEDLCPRHRIRAACHHRAGVVWTSDCTLCHAMQTAGGTGLWSSSGTDASGNDEASARPLPEPTIKGSRHWEKRPRRVARPLTLGFWLASMANIVSAAAARSGGVARAHGSNQNHRVARSKRGAPRRRPSRSHHCLLTTHTLVLTIHRPPRRFSCICNAQARFLKRDHCTVQPHRSASIPSSPDLRHRYPRSLAPLFIPPSF